MVLGLGLLHLDLKRGEVTDTKAMNALMLGDLVVGREVVTCDVAHANYAFVVVKQDTTLPFLAEAMPSPGAQDSGRSIVKSLHRPCG